MAFAIVSGMSRNPCNNYAVLEVTQLDEVVGGDGLARASGVLRTIGAVGEVAIGGALIASGAGAPLGALLVVHGLDNAYAGYQTASEEMFVDAYTTLGLEAAGLSPQVARAVDAGIGFIGSSGAALISPALRAMTTGASGFQITGAGVGMVATGAARGAGTLIEQGTRAWPQWNNDPSPRPVDDTE
jgi:hypothetical protein